MTPVSVPCNTLSEAGRCYALRSASVMRLALLALGSVWGNLCRMPTDDNPRKTSGPNEPAPTVMDPTRLPSTNELIGQILNGRYLIQNELKRGGMGVVYLALDQQLHSRPVVVKVLLDEAYQSEYVVQKFRQEVEALSRIDHPGIVGIIDAGELQNGRPFIIMQYVEGVTLRSVMSPEGMNLERTAELLKQIGRALAAAHNRGILHRDLKPDNIMLQNLGHGEEQIKIIDFGIAKVKDSVVAPSTSLNLSPGTVAYMAPEQLNGRAITAATDIFSLGAIAYEMVTGRKPFNPETGFELLQMQQTGVRVKPADLRPSLPIKAQEVILKALSFNPADRYGAPREFADSFAGAISQELQTGGVSEPTDFALPRTQLSSEETPLAKASPGPHPKTLQVPFRPAQSPDPSGAQPGPGPSVAQLGLGGRAGDSRRSKSKLVPLLAGVCVLVLAVAGLAAWYVIRSRTSEAKNPLPPSGAERLLSYGLTVQKMRSGRPYQDTFESSGQEIFENGWKFRMRLTSPQAGYLYLLNEGPSAGGATTYNLLSAASATDSKVPPVTANQKIETAWMVFDEHQGTEKFWIVWAAEAVPEMEAVKRVINAKDKGEIGDADQAKVQRFLEKHSSEKPESQKDTPKRQTKLKGKGNVLVHLLELEHH
ncbi:MAG: serine/threonine protein kinase [Pyrinomonadaceae bacterium]